METQSVITLTPEEIKKIITRYLQKRRIRVTGDFKFLFGTRFEGYGPMEHKVEYFDGCSFKTTTVIPDEEV